MDMQVRAEQQHARASRVSARREEAYRQSMLLAEQRRRDVEHRNTMAAELGDHREDLRQLQLQIKVRDGGEGLEEYRRYGSLRNTREWVKGGRALWPRACMGDLRIKV